MQLIIFFLFILLDTYSTLIFVDIILSWFPRAYRFKFFRLIHKITDAYMGFFSGYLTVGYLDFTPIVGIILFDAFIYAFQWCLI